MKKRTKRGSLFTLLLGNYIVFTILVIVLFVAAILLAFGGNKLNLIDLEQVSEYETLLASGQYEQFPATRLLGKDGVIAVLDENGQIVYNSGELNIKLSANETAYIPDATSKCRIDTREIKTSLGKTNYEITVLSDASEADVFILDEKYKVIYGSKDWLGTQLSEKKYLLLSNKFFDGYTVNKFQFRAENGSLHFLLLFRRTDAAFAELQKLGTVFSQCILYFTILYILLIILLIFWLKKKINKPLRLLCNTFEDYHIGQSIAQNYHGPKEFVNIFENFSAMAHRLDESEKQKKFLEENRRKMIADIAHDFKTPIAVIRGYAKAIEDGIVPLQEQNKYLSIIDRKSAQLNELILTFYEYSKIEHPDFKFDMEETDICNYFRDFVAEQYSELEISGFEVETNIPEIHIFCKIDRIQFKRVFANIVGNAANHTKAGTTLYFDLVAKKGMVILTLANNGSGISPEIAENIFTPFVTGDCTRKGEGSGLGLSISKKIVEEHSGKLELLSNNSSEWNTVFKITLPTV